MINLVLNNKLLDALDLSPLWPSLPTNNSISQINCNSGVEVYRLLFYISKVFNNSIICDVGTNSGISCVTLSSDLSNKVFTFDIRERQEFLAEQMKCEINNSRKEILVYPVNVNYIIGNVLDFIDKLLISKLIYLDANFGKITQDIINKLIENKYRGVAILDDIHYWPEMKNLWDNLNIPKLDLTKYGHHAGTGLIDFGNNLDIIIDE